MQLRKIDFGVAVVAALVAAFLSAATLTTLIPLTGQMSIENVIRLFPVYFIFCLIVEIFLGISLFLLLLRLNLVRWWVWFPVSVLFGVNLSFFIGALPQWDSLAFFSILSSTVLSALIFRLALFLVKRTKSNAQSTISG